MKYSIIILFFAAIAFSCDSVDDLLKTSANYTVEQSVNVDLKEDSPTKTFSDQKTFAAPADINKFGSNLDAIEITGISMKFDNYEGDQIIIETAELVFDGTGVSLGVEEIDLDAVTGTGQTGVVKLNIDGLDLSAINAEFLTNKEITVSISGTVNNVPVVFDVTFTIDIKVTGSI